MTDIKKITALVAATALLLCLVQAVSAEAAPYIGADIFRYGTDNSANSRSWFSGAEYGSIQTSMEGWIEFETYMYAGDWNIGLNVMNAGLAPEDYEEFFIEARLYETATGRPVEKRPLRITESGMEANYGFLSEEIKEGKNYTVRFTWLNDYSNPDLGYDTGLLVYNAFFDDPSTAPITGPAPIPGPPPASVPEPSTLLLLGAGLLGILPLGRRFRKKQK